MELPTAALVAELVAKLDDNLREAYEERAGIMEFDAKLPRPYAECLALLDILYRDPLALAGITVLQIELDGQTEWLITTDLAYARQRVSDICAEETGVVDLVDVINEQYGGIAMLATVG